MGVIKFVGDGVSVRRNFRIIFGGLCFFVLRLDDILCF